MAKPTGVDDFAIIHVAVCELHEIWNVITDLFGRDEDVKVLDQTGCTAWTTIGNSLMDSVILALTRLVTDSDHNGKKMQLQRIIEAQSDAALKSELAALVVELKKTMHKLELHRHNRIAHWGCKSARSDVPLESATPSINLADVGEPLRRLREFMNRIHQTKDRTEFGYGFTRQLGDAKEILDALNDGLRLRDLRDACWEGRPADEILRELQSYPDAG